MRRTNRVTTMHPERLPFCECLPSAKPSGVGEAGRTHLQDLQQVLGDGHDSCGTQCVLGVLVEPCDLRGILIGSHGGGCLDALTKGMEPIDAI